MPIALTDDHRALADVARSLLVDRDVAVAARDSLEGDPGRPAFWADMCALGWPGLHLPEEHGGQGFGLLELAIVTEALGAVVAPGPFLPTVLASAVIAEIGTTAQRAAWLPGLADGSVTAAVGLGAAVRREAGTISGEAGAILGATAADRLLVALGDDLVMVGASSPGVTIAQTDGLDTTRRFGRVGLTAVSLDDADVLVGGAPAARRIGRILAAAEAAGGARACTEMAVEYAKVREQFGRPIGSFQAIKHHCANMLVDSELAAAVAWDAARTADSATGEQGGASVSLAAAVAAAQALPAYRRCAEVNIQVHGGIGYTFEHAAHLHLRRATTMAAVFGADHDAPLEVAASIGSGVSREVRIELPPEAEVYRAEAVAFRQQYDAVAPQDRRVALIDSGYYLPHWPAPWGRAAGAVEQLVIDEELGHVEQPDLGIGGWVMLTIVQHGTAEQLERWVRPTLLGELRWCQLFSEPNAGSDAAAITTKATRVDGGWLVNGQKVWTSGAQACNRGLATVRTDPEAAKHAGVTTVAIDLTAAGVDVRPLREITGETLFNEVFFDDVFVPDDDVIGTPNQGWTVARATLGNERVSIGGNKGSLDLIEARDLLDMVNRAGWAASGDTGLVRAVGSLLAEELAMDALNLRHVMRALIGGPPGPEGNITKLLSAEHSQRVAGLGLRIGGLDAVSGTGGLDAVSGTGGLDAVSGTGGLDASISAEAVGYGSKVARDYLFTRCLTIAGGTSEIVRNLIAERLLGLPREPAMR